MRKFAATLGAKAESGRQLTGNFGELIQEEGRY